MERFNNNNNNKFDFKHTTLLISEHFTRLVAINLTSSLTSNEKGGSERCFYLFLFIFHFYVCFLMNYFFDAVISIEKKKKKKFINFF